MKRIGKLYEKVYDIENLRIAHKNARKGKGFYKEVKMVNSNEDYYLRQIQYMLINKTYKTSEYKIFKKWDKVKEREIYKLPYYPDRIVQWAIMQVIEPILFKNMTINTFSAISKRGIHFGLKRVEKSLKDKENTKYCLKFDIHHYYPSINHQILKQKYQKLFKDKDLLWILDEIIDSVKMSEDTGIPIGNYLSQWSANLYLSDFDHWLKEEKHCKYVFRYMDDVVILAKSKEELHNLLKEIKTYLKNMKLELKGNYQIFPIDVRGIDFLGYRIFRNYILLRKSTCKNFKRKMIKISKKLKRGYKLTFSDDCSIHSYIGWLKWCDSYRLKHKYIKTIIQQIGDDDEEIMKKFSEFAKDEIGVAGDKIKINDILGKTIIVTGYKISDSKYKKNEEDKLLTLQFKINNEEKILFTGSKVLQEQCEKYKDEIPFETIIKKSNKFYTFS